MGHNNGIISTPINIQGDIGYILGVSSGDVWTLYNHNAVKMWSKRKPVPWSINGVKALNPQGDHPAGSSHPWFTGIDGDYGIVSKTTGITGSNGLFASTDGNLNGWSYQRDALVARVLDFDGYFNGAVNPFDSVYLNVQPLSVAQGGTLTMEYRVSQDISSAYQIGLFDLAVKKTGASGGIASISTMYPAIAIFGSDGSYKTWAAATETIGALQSDRTTHHFDFTAPSTLGTYKVIPFLSPTVKGDKEQPDECVTIPGASIIQIEVARFVEPYMEIVAFVDSSSQQSDYGNKIYFYCDFHGGSNDSGSFYDVELTFESGGNPQMVLHNVQHNGTRGTITPGVGATIEEPSTTEMYWATWTGLMSLSSFIQNGGIARMSMPSSSTVAQATTSVFPAPALPSRTPKQFGQ